MDSWDDEIEPRLNEFSRLRWREIDNLSSDSGHKLHHEMLVEDICVEAQQRLTEIELEVATLFRFRYGNLKRLWGQRVGPTFMVLWWDPTHQIYPVEP